MEGDLFFPTTPRPCYLSVCGLPCVVFYFDNEIGCIIYI